MAASQPAIVATSPGTQAPAGFSFTGATGGDTSLNTTAVGGIGAAFSITGGTGGVAASAVTASTGGKGGTITYTGGTGGAANAAANVGTNVGGAGGDFVIVGGTGGNAANGTDTGGAGGHVYIVGGAGGTGDSAGADGTVYIGLTSAGAARGAVVLGSAMAVNDDVRFTLGTGGDIVLVNRSTILDANATLASVMIGTPVTPAVAADSLILSNITQSGDILIAANNGGNSQAWLWVDSSAGTMTLYGAGVAQAILTNTAVTVQDDILLGLGTGSTARFSYDTTDADANALLIQLPAGGATDVPVLAIGQSIESVDLGLFTGVVDPNIALFGVGAVTTGTRLRAYKARGTIASPTVVTSGDDLFSIDAYGAVAAGEYVQAARILFEMTGTIATTRGPGVITFQTATDVAPSVLTTAMTINAAQLVTCAAGVTLTTGNLTFAAASDIVFPAATAAALELSDGTTKFYAIDSRVATVGAITHTLNISAYTLASAANAVATGWSLAAHTLNLTGNTQVTSEAISANIGARTIAADGVGGACTVDLASSLKVVAPTEGANVTLTAASAIRIGNAAGTPTNQYGLYIEALSGGTTANRGIYLAGANGIQFAAADDILVIANTAAALEVSDGTTKYYAFDTRIGAAGVTTHALDISDYTFASGATNVATGLSLAAHTLNYTGATQVTSEVITASIGARTIASDTATLTVDLASTLKLVAPTEGTNVTLSAAAALRIGDAGGTPTNQYGIFIESLAAGATADYAIWVAGANAVHLGTEGSATGLLEISGGTSGTATITVAAATTSYTMTLPAAANTNAGYQLTCAGADTVTSWAAAASLREYKNIEGRHDAQDALDKILSAKVYDFHYKYGKGTLDSKTAYVGIMADEAPWAMHHEGGVVNPVNTLGFTVLGFQAMAERIEELESKLAALQA